MLNILILCHANQFRSPLVEYALRAKLDPAVWQIASAGVWAQDGLPAVPGLAAWSKLPAMAAHRSRALHFSMLESADVILVMERGQKEAIQVEFPQVAMRVYLLSEMSSRVAYDIPDPAIGGENPHRLIEEILGLVEKGLPRIKALAEFHAQRADTL